MANKNKAVKPSARVEQNDTLATTTAFFTKYKKLIIGILAALVVVVGSWLAFKYLYLAPQEDKAQSYLSQGIQYVLQGDQLMQQVAQGEEQMANDTTGADSTVKKQVADMKKQATDMYNKALKGEAKFPGYIKVANNYSMTDASNLAKGQVGIIYHKMGNYKEAIKWLEDFTPQSDKTISPAIVAALGHAYAGNNQVDKAVETLKKAAELANEDVASAQYLVDAGKLLESQNNKKGALEIYTQVKKDYPKSTYCQPQNMNGTFTEPIIDGLIELVK